MARGYVRGRAGHGSRPYDGSNAFEGAAAVAKGLIDSAPALCSIKSELPVARPEDAYGVMTLGGRVSTTTQKVNVIPGKFSFTIDRRLLPEEDPERVQSEIEERALESLPVDGGLSLEIRRFELAPAVVCPNDSELVRTLAGILEGVYGEKAERRLSAFFTDMRFLSQRGIPCCGHSVRSCNIHGANEGVHRKDLLDTAFTLALLYSSFG